MRGDRKYRGAAAVSVVQSLNQVRVPRSAAACADREPPGELRFGRRCERPRLLVADVDPLDPRRSSDGVHEGVQAVTDDAIYTRDAGLCSLWSPFVINTPNSSVDESFRYL